MSILKAAIICNYQNLCLLLEMSQPHLFLSLVAWTAYELCSVNQHRFKLQLDFLIIRSVDYQISTILFVIAEFSVIKWVT